MDAAAQLRVWMAEKNISVKGLAALLNCHPDGVSDWRHGKARPQPVHRAALERISEGRIPASIWERAA